MNFHDGFRCAQPIRISRGTPDRGMCTLINPATKSLFPGRIIFMVDRGWGSGRVYAPSAYQHAEENCIKTQVDSSMVVGDRAPVSRMLELAHQLEGLARLDKPVDVAPAVHSSRRRTSEFVDATGVGGYARLFEQRERIGAALPLAILFRHEPRADQESVECGHHN